MVLDWLCQLLPQSVNEIFKVVLIDYEIKEKKMLQLPVIS